MRSSFSPGCLLPLLLLLSLFRLPLLLADALLTALARLGFDPQTSIPVVSGIFLGGMGNVPVKKIPREEIVEMASVRLFGLSRFFPVPVPRRTYTIIAVNVGGCLIPGARGSGLRSSLCKETTTGMASIGGAGTFDGIVLSSLIATLLA